MLTLLADMMFTAAGYRGLPRTHTPDTRAHWAGRYDDRAHRDVTRPPYRFDRFRDLW